MINSPLTVALNTSTFVPVTLPDLSPRMDVSVFTEDGSPFEIATDVSGTDAVTVPTGVVNIPRVNTNDVLLYARAASGAVNLAVIYGRSAR